MKTLRLLLCAIVLGGAGLILTGCATDNSPDNVSSLPWNSPQGWEGPLPSTINQGR